jgi:predicted nucleic acid-binding protein
LEQTKTQTVSALIYVETTIPSFYCETRAEADVRVRRKWTREWWHLPQADQRRVTSAVVVEELERIPDSARREAALALIRPLEQLDYTEAVAEVVAVYLQHKLMPREAIGDADHLALASHYGCDMLVTWNCRHLANANKAAHIRRVNALLGLQTPLLVTPLELLNDEDENEA